ncbi:hypothetical protein TRFO_06806 [Tritrichomonas foetus]|uniref:Ubiquitin-like domain-containing protein n=1 Tax=Tritrichomonas foetus TaxID=1144522 RepID=A0A1J4JVI9_9EUKA|nr:hypothetical protein TRFO_06806 [Tritrichomonas foetus]|eukprot:OHT03145.1 hypothetical protein TRFO_06806 [Tritrichomonas foetus]
MNLQICTSKGDEYQVFIDKKATTYDLKSLIETKYQIPNNKIVLIFHNKILKDSENLSVIGDNNTYPSIMMELLEMTNHNEESLSAEKENLISKIPNFMENVKTAQHIMELKKLKPQKFVYDHRFDQRYPLTIISPDFKEIRLVMSPNSTIGDILQKLKFDHSKYSIYKTKQNLYNNSKLSDFGINSNHCIQCTFSTISKKYRPATSVIAMNVMSEISFNLAVFEEMTISEVKTLIQKKQNISNIDVIFLLFETRILEDHKRLSDYRIPHNALIKFGLLNLQYVIGIESRNFSRVLFVENDCTIQDLMQIITPIFKIDSKSQILFLNGQPITGPNGIFHENAKLSQISDRKRVFIIEVRSKSDPFFLIKYHQLDYKVDIDSPDDSIYQLKQKIFQNPKLQILISQQQLSYKNRILNDQELISETKIRYGEVLTLSHTKHQPEFPLSIDLCGQPIKMNVHSNMYIFDIKHQISQHSTIDSQSLKFSIQPEKLDINSRLVEIPNNGHLNFVILSNESTINVKIKTITNNNFDINVNPECLVLDFKNTLHNLLGSLSRNLKILYNGVPLSEISTLKSAGVKDSDEIFVLAKT